MRFIRMILLLDQPNETRFFGFLGVFGIVLGGIYWFSSFEPAGTVLLLGFGLACFLGAVRLVLARPRTVRAGSEGRPFTDESGRLPDETLAPLAIGLGIALAVTAVVFGPWLLIAGVLPFAWGAREWLRGAREELDAVVESERREPHEPADDVARASASASVAGASASVAGGSGSFAGGSGSVAGRSGSVAGRSGHPVRTPANEPGLSPRTDPPGAQNRS